MGNVKSFSLSCLVSITSKVFHFVEVKMFPFDLIISICVILASEADENISSKNGNV